jgi:hypothetical protein
MVYARPPTMAAACASMRTCVRERAGSVLSLAWVALYLRDLVLLMVALSAERVGDLPA